MQEAIIPPASIFLTNGKLIRPESYNKKLQEGFDFRATKLHQQFAGLLTPTRVCCDVVKRRVKRDILEETQQNTSRRLSSVMGCSRFEVILLVFL